LQAGDLNGVPYVAFDRALPIRKAIDRALRQRGARPNIVMEFDNIETIKRSIEVGIGVSILPETAVANEVRNKQLVTLDFAEGVFTRSIGIIHRKGKVFSAAASEFVKTLTSK
jgi:LysR family transcriptional regulator, transcriptional activator of the cysJI operon